MLHPLHCPNHFSFFIIIIIALHLHHHHQHQPQLQLALRCFGSDLIIFIISGFLSGEYVLRIFPLICKATQSHRLSLSLLGSNAEPVGMYGYGHEGPCYGINTFWRDFERIVACGHSIFALKLNGMEGKSDIIGRYFTTSLHSISRLTKLEIHNIMYDEDDATALLIGVWTLPLTSLTCVGWYVQDKTVSELGPPAFARTLHTLKTEVGGLLLARLALYCRNLKDLTVKYNFCKIIANNLNLTALSLRVDTEDGIDLTQHIFLTKLTLDGKYPIFSKDVHPTIEYLSLIDPDPGYAKEFLHQCPALKHACISCDKWSDIVDIISVLDPNKCKQLTLEGMENIDLPTFEELEESVLKRGFQLMNQELLLWVNVNSNNNNNNWERIMMDVAPEMKSWEVLDMREWGSNSLHMLSSFSSLFFLKFSSMVEWDQDTFAMLMKCCPVLRNLHINTVFAGGTLALHSTSLCKLSVELREKGVSDFDLKLPNLTHLTLKLTNDNHRGAETFVQQLLDGDELIELPRLSVLFVWGSPSSSSSSPPPPSKRVIRQGVIPCKAGHQSLANLFYDFDLFKLTLQNLPFLRRVCLRAWATDNMSLDLDVPGDCDLDLSSDNNFAGDAIAYSRIGASSVGNFRKTLHFKGNQWIETDLK